MRNVERDQQVAMLYRQGFTIDAIAEQVRIGRRSVFRIFAR